MADAQPAGHDLPPPGGKKGFYEMATLAAFGLIVLAACACLPVVIWEMWVNKFQLHMIAWVVAGGFTCLTVPISIYEISNHLRNYRCPKLQRYVIRILWMPAIYAMDSFLSLRYKGEALYWEAIRDVYEAWTIYAFYSYLCAYLEGEKGKPGSLTVNPVITQSHDHKHMFPFCWLKPWSMHDGKFVRWTHVGVAQYCFINVACAISIFATEHTHTYHDGTTKPTVAWPYIAFTINVSQVWALYCLVLMYHSFQHELKPINPFLKFVCIKAVVFFTFWQDMLLTALVHQGVIKEKKSWTSYNPETSYTLEEVKDGLQNFIVCIEMFFAALAHAYAFPIYDYKDRPDRAPLSFGEVLVQVFGVLDVLRDVFFHFGCVRVEFTEADIDTSVYDRVKAEEAGEELDEDGRPRGTEMQPPSGPSVGPSGAASPAPGSDVSGRPAAAGAPPAGATAYAGPPPPKEEPPPGFIAEVVDVTRTFFAAVFGSGAKGAGPGAAPAAAAAGGARPPGEQTPTRARIEFMPSGGSRG